MGAAEPPPALQKPNPNGVKTFMRVVTIYNQTITWPELCVNCYQRRATARVRITGRFFWSGNLHVPFCGDCEAARNAAFLRAVRYVAFALLPMATLGPLALYSASQRLHAPATAPALIVVIVGLLSWFIGWIVGLYATLRKQSRQLGQAAILWPILVYRTFDAPIPGRRHYRLGVRQVDLAEFLCRNNDASC